MGCHAFPGAGKTKPLFRGGFDVDLLGRNMHTDGQVFAHTRNMGSQLGPLSQNGRIHIAHSPALFRQQRDHMIQQFQAVGTGACGPAIMPEYQYSAKKDYELRFLIQVS